MEGDKIHFLTGQSLINEINSPNTSFVATYTLGNGEDQEIKRIF
jgi:hypothetical protein